MLHLQFPVSSPACEQVNIPPSSPSYGQRFRESGSKVTMTSRLLKSTFSASIFPSPPQPGSKPHPAKPQCIQHLSRLSTSSRHPKSLPRDRKTPNPRSVAPAGGEKKRQGNMGILTIVNQLDEKFGVVRGRWVVGVVVRKRLWRVGGYCCHRERRSVGGLLGSGTVYGLGCPNQSRDGAISRTIASDKIGGR